MEIKLVYSIPIGRKSKEFLLLHVSFNEDFGVLYANGICSSFWNKRGITEVYLNSSYTPFISIIVGVKEEPASIDREFEFYEFFSLLKFNEFYEFFFRLKKIRKKFVILQTIDV